MTAQRSEVSSVICSTYLMLSLLKFITSSIEGEGGRTLLKAITQRAPMSEVAKPITRK